MMNYYISPTKITHLLATFLIIFFLFSSCRNGDSGNQCFENRTDEPIDIYIDGDYEFTLDEDDDTCFDLFDGCYDWYVEGVLSGNFQQGEFCIIDDGFGTTIVIE